MSERASRRKGGGRAGRREARGSSAAEAAPFIERKIPYVEILSEENLQLIEHNADRLLAEIGIDFLDDPEVLDLFREAGADVDGTRVRFPPACVDSIIQATAPSEYVQHARNPRAASPSAASARCWFPPTAHPSCTTSTRVDVTRPSRTSKIS